MTNEERLAWIEANSYLYPTSIADLRWLIAEVRRLTDENESACEKIKELTVMLENATAAIGTWKGEYARGRADERAAVVAKLRHEAENPTPQFDSRMVKLLSEFLRYCANRIERGEHVEATDAT